MPTSPDPRRRETEEPVASSPSEARPLIWLLLLFISVLVLQPPVDPDFGWHLRTGLDLVHHGRIPETDPYSHTMPDWPWVEHAWLADVVIGALYASMGGWGLSAIIVLFGAVTMWAFFWSASLAPVGAVPRLMAVSAALWVAWPFLGVRTQMITLFGLAIVSWVWTRVHHGHLEVSWTLPLIFLIWCNVHGGFTAGFFYLGLSIALALVVELAAQGAIPVLSDRLRRSGEPILSRGLLGRVTLIVVISALATVLNPYGWHLHREIYQSLTDRFMLEVLHEWQPPSIETRAGRWFVGYVGLLGFLMAGWYRRVEPIRLATLAVFLGLAFRHFRNIPFFLLLSLPLLAELLHQLGRQLVEGLLRSPTLMRGASFALLVGTAGLLLWLGPDHVNDVARAARNPGAYFQGTAYPIEAALWVQRHRERVGNRMFNEYGDGGFLSWWLPEHKIFIDGRMPAWRIGDRWIFYDYVALTMNDPPTVSILEKYEADWGLVKKDSPLERALRARADWELVYEDSKVSILVKRVT